MIEDGNFDVILSDFRMPGFDGPWLYTQIHQLRPDLLDRMAFITGDTLSKDVASFFKETGIPHIEKPITPKDIRDLLVALVEG
ncbi:MAG: response regulator [Motiliproteus sp.]